MDGCVGVGVWDGLNTSDLDIWMDGWVNGWMYRHSTDAKPKRNKDRAIYKKQETLEWISNKQTNEQTNEQTKRTNETV